MVFFCNLFISFRLYFPTIKVSPPAGLILHFTAFYAYIYIVCSVDSHNLISDYRKRHHCACRYPSTSRHSADEKEWWRHQMGTNFPRYWPFVREIHLSPVNFPREGQWRGALMFSLICARKYGWVKKREAGDLRRHRAHSDVIVMALQISSMSPWILIIPHQFVVDKITSFEEIREILRHSAGPDIWISLSISYNSQNSRT